MALRINIETDNAQMSTAAEVANELRRIAHAIDGGATDGRAKDLNGNTVGQWTLTLPDPTEPED